MTLFGLGLFGHGDCLSKWDKMGRESFRICEVRNASVKVGSECWEGELDWKSDFLVSLFWVYQMHNPCFDMCGWQLQMMYLFCQQTFVVYQPCASRCACPWDRYRDPYDRTPELKKLKTRGKGPKPFRIPLTWHAWYLANSVHYVLWDHSSHFIDVEAKACFSVELVWVSQLEREKLDFEPGLSHSRTLLSFHKAMQQVTPSLRCHLLKKSIHFITFLD